MRFVTKQLWLAVALVAGMLLSGCNGVKADNQLAKYVFTDFETVTPEIAPVYTDYSVYPNPGKVVWPIKKPEEIRVLLSEKDRSLTIQKYDAHSRLSYLAGSANLDAGQYVITLSNVRFRAERVTDGATLCKGSTTECEPLDMVQMGVGARLVAEVNVMEGGVNTGTLLPLGIQSSGKKVTGKMRLVTFGIVPKSGGLSSPGLSLTVDDTAIQAMLQSIAVLESQIEASDVTLVPYLIGVKSSTPPQGPQSNDRVLRLESGAKAVMKENVVLYKKLNPVK